MGNHYHLLLETPEANLVTGMKWLQGTYTQRFNARHKQQGHLMQGRYKALPVDCSAGEYFQTLGSYIHLNPVRAALFDLENDDLSNYRWSSYPLYFLPSKRPVWLCVDRLLGCMGLVDDKPGRNAFRRAMQKRVAEVITSGNPKAVDQVWNKIRRGWFFGSERFRDELLEKLDEVIGVKGKRESFNGAEARLHDEAEAERLLHVGLKRLNIHQENLELMRKNCPEKCCLAWLLRKRTCVSNEWIKRHVHMGKATNFSALVKRAESAEGSYRQIMKKLQNIKISD
jgi:hypothetical protein